jgi:SUMO ligase MMS21 Smc5/6 complex component
MKMKKIAGCLSYGLGSEIHPKHGIEGFYLNELFRFEPELHDMMHNPSKCAFIIKEYQQNQCLSFTMERYYTYNTIP